MLGKNVGSFKFRTMNKIRTHPLEDKDKFRTMDRIVLVRLDCSDYIEPLNLEHMC